MRYRGRIMMTLCATAAMLLTLAATAVAAPVFSAQLVDRPTGFGALPFDGVSTASIGTHALSADGRYLVFSSSTDVLLAGDEDSAENVYRLDRSTGTLAQVNLTAANGQPLAFSFSEGASVSANGRYVEFESNAANLVPGGPADGFYVKDMQTGAVELASRATGPNGAAAAGLRFAVISGDGRHVAFSATGALHADNADGADRATDAYVRALDAGTTHMVSVTATGGEAGGVNDRSAPDIDFNGDAAAFITDARLNPGDADDTNDAYVRTGIGAQSEITRFVSFTTGQTPLADSASQVALSGEGSLVAWANGEDGGTDLGRSVFMTSLLPAVAPAQRVDVSRPGGFGSGGGDPAFEPVASAARFPALLYFRSSAGLDGGDTNDNVDLYAAEVAHPGDGNFVRLETSGKANGSADAGAGAAAGTVVAFASAATSLPGADGERAQVYVHDATGDGNVSQPAGAAPRTSPAGPAFLHTLHAISDDGRKVAFHAAAPAFGSVPATRRIGFSDQAIVRDVVSGQTTLVSAAADGSPANDDAHTTSIDAAGDRAAFVSAAANLAADPNPGHNSHAYVRDLASGALTLVDRTAAGAPLRNGIIVAEISPDGHHLVYESSSPDAPQAPANDTHDHIYVAISIAAPRCSPTAPPTALRPTDRRCAPTSTATARGLHSKATPPTSAPAPPIRHSSTFVTSPGARRPGRRFRRTPTRCTPSRTIYH